MLQKIYKFFSQKCQGIVEYVLMLGFVAEHRRLERPSEYALLLGLVAIIAAYLISGFGLVDSIDDSVDIVKSQLKKSRF